MWKFAFFIGLITLPNIFGAIWGKSLTINGTTFIMFDSNASTIAHLDLYGWVIGGILVGFGTRMGNGCTSGHGVCGLPRFSIRSFVATCTFMMTGFLMATLRFNYPFFTNGIQFSDSYDNLFEWFTLCAFVALYIYFVLVIVQASSDRKREIFYSYLVGIIFGAGLMISGMCRMSKIIGFLIIDTNRWDPSLIFVMLSAVSVNLVTIRSILSRSAPKHQVKFEVPNPKASPDARLVIGSAIFGLGWGLSGLCPGPGMINLFFLTHATFWILGLALG